MTPADLKKLRETAERADVASGRPWIACRYTGNRAHWLVLSGTESDGDWVAEIKYTADRAAVAQHIAAANPQTILALLDRINELDQQRDADIARGLGDALAIVQRRLGHYQRMTGPEMKAHPATIATLEEIAVFIEAALMRALEPDREPGDGYCACGERLDKPHNHDGDFR